MAALDVESIHGDGWWRYRIPGAGEVSWQRFFMKLHEIGYDGDVLIEHGDPVFEGARHFEGSAAGQAIPQPVPLTRSGPVLGLKGQDSRCDYQPESTPRVDAVTVAWAAQTRQ